MECLKLNNISKKINGRKILDGISLAVDKGEIVGFVGPNGAGKTTTIRIITNYIRPDCGNIIICGYDLNKEREKALSHISGIVETPSLFKYLSGLDNIEFVRKVKGISKEKMLKIIQDIGLTSRIKDKVSKYSLGMKQRLALGIALLSDPDLLILDEPTNGLDPSGIIELRNMLVNINRKNGISIFISSHNLSEIRRICNRIIYIKDGKIIATKSYKNEQDLKKYRLKISDSEMVKHLANDCSSILNYVIDGNYIAFDIEKNGLKNFMSCLIDNNINFENIESLSDDYD
ncbi:MAG TPA: ABC transporter ATP-binding protein, partial [Ruminiclostridium sp.]|nr:ABC transporter ATP-binding protein [Ruminiclostridium sp.]